MAIDTPTAQRTDQGSNDQPSVPRHVAIIMDGNGRWARAQGKDRNFGHRAGTENIRNIIRLFGEAGVRYLTVYAFSTENWSRPKSEVRALMGLIGQVLRREVKKMHKEGVRLHHIGKLDVLSDSLRKQILDAVELTRKNERIDVTVAFNYGGRDELVDAVRRLIKDGWAPEAISEDVISQHLYTAGIPDPDLIIRTAGEMRLSNFLVWQAAYAEFWSTPTLWPDFGEKDIQEALTAYAERTRKFGAVVES
ncbi:MAG TPA: polyprenyl diphosphate synthase [Dehalococcoidia bacterium]|nr:polyprenyl diphosphate synthase [Dehalococcoidia bacterium]